MSPVAVNTGARSLGKGNRKKTMNPVSQNAVPQKRDSWLAEFRPSEVRGRIERDIRIGGNPRSRASVAAAMARSSMRA